MRIPILLTSLCIALFLGHCAPPTSPRHPLENWINTLSWTFKKAPEEALPLDTFLLLKQRVLELEKADPDQYFAVMARAYILWANYADVQGEESDILPWLQKAENLLENRPEPLAQELLGTVYNYLASYYEIKREDSGMANAYKQKSLAIDKRFGNTENLLIAYMNLGYNAVNQGRYEQAFVYFDSALLYQAALPLDTNTFVNHCGAHYNIGRAFINQGIDWWEEGRTQAAQACYERALKEYQEALAVLDRFPQIPSNNVRFFVQQNIARTLLEMNDPQRNAILLQASQVLPDILPGNAERDNSLKSLAYAHWAYALAKNGAIQEARKTFDIGQRIQTRLLAGEYPSAYNEQNYARFLFLKAQMLEVIAEKSTAVQDFQASLEGYDALLQYLDRQEREMVSEEGLERLRKFYAQAAGKAVKQAMNLFRRTGLSAYKEKAFQFAEQSKAGNLRQTIGFALSGADLQGGMKKLHDQEQHFRRQISRLESLFYQDTLARKRRVWQDSVLLLRKQYAQFVQEIRQGKQKEGDSYYQLKFGKTEVSTRALQQQLLNPETAIVEYQWYGPNGYAFVITQNRFEVVDLVMDTVLLGHIQALQENLRFEKPVAEYAHHAYALYIKLLEPVVHNALTENIKELIVVPDKMMSGMVLENLITQTPAPNATFADLSYLLRQFSLSYSYSIGSSWLAKERSDKNAKPSKAFVGFIASPDGRASGTAPDAACSTAPLPKLSKMTQQIGQQYFPGGTGKLVSQATKKDYFKYAAQADILHFALHGCLSEQDQYLGNNLQFLPNEQGAEMALNSGEIMQSSLRARLAVLASCNTAQGAWNRNEGLKSIARSFFIAGCPAVLATLHPVNEATTANILEQFYPALLAGNSKAAALQKAKLDFLARADAAFVHPKYWANMVLIGDATPMR